MTLFMCVSRDIYELPMAVADSQRELANMLCVGESTVCKGLQKRLRGGKSIYVAVRVEDDDAED